MHLPMPPVPPVQAKPMDPVVQLVDGWPDVFAAKARSTLVRLHDTSSLQCDELAELAIYGVWDAEHRKLTPAGENLVDLVVHESWQEQDEVEAFLRRGSERLSGDVLDVGCSTGWTLRTLRRPMPRSRVGVDIDDRALTLGRRFAESEQQEVTFCNASVHELPFPTDSFDWVICRNAISYTHQRTAIGEMSRVLRPGGYLFLRFENIRYDLQHITEARGVKETLCRLRDLSYGVMHTLSGRQPVPGSLLRGGRAMGSVRRLTQFLNDRELNVIESAPSRCCPLFRGKPNQTSILSRKRGELAVAPWQDTLAANGSLKMVRG